MRGGKHQFDCGQPQVVPTTNNTYIVIYNGDPMVTLELALDGMITNSNMIFMIYDEMLATNTVLVKIMQRIIEDKKISSFVKLYNNVCEKDIKKSASIATKIIYIGDRFEYQNVKKSYDIPVIYNGYGNVVIYCEEENSFRDELIKMHEFAYDNGITIDFYDGELEKELEYINYDVPADTVAIFSNDEQKIKRFLKKCNAKKILVNQNPFENYRFEFDINQLVINT